MTVWQLVIKEIIRRKSNFVSGLVAVTLAVAVLAGSMTILRLHDLRTERIVARKERETKDRLATLEDDYRKIMKNLGFNLLIFPENQRLSDFYADDVVSAYMPEIYATRLAEAKIVTIRHLLPSLQEKVKWPERKRTVILIGSRGEVPSLFRDAREPILVAVPKGRAVIGHELAESLGLKSGDPISLFGRTFTISHCNEERGSKDDISIWIDLAEAQELLNKPGRINAILALKCICAGNELALVRRDVAAVLPGVQVIEQGSKVLTRAEARDRAAQEAADALAAEVRNRRQLREEQERFSAILVPLVLFVSALWIGLVFYTNVRERRSEIGILRALGARSRTILRLFLTKALLMGFVGGLTGYAVGVGGRNQPAGGSDVLALRAPPHASRFDGCRDPLVGRQLAPGVLCRAAGPGGSPEGGMSDVLLLERVVKTYPKGNLRITALAPIDLTVGPGEFVALRGPSGSGKTTCLLVAGGLLHPDSGQVLVDGHDFYAMPRNRLASFRAQNIGFVFQQYHLIPYLTVLENILAPEAAWGRQDNRARGILLAEQFGLAHRLDHTPAELSSGEKQRTALARALLFKPKVILADEVTGNLDQANAQIVLGYLREYVGTGGSVLLVTHDREIAAQADRVEHLPDCARMEALQ